jgi:tetratricopeptide (TPR) repeat protein/Tol biopolymer transport system component
LAKAEVPAAPPAPQAPQAPALHITYPYDEAVFPPEIVAPTVRWTDTTGASTWRLDFEVPDGRSFHREVNSTSYRPDRELWEELKLATRDSMLTLKIKGVDQSDPPKVLGMQSLRFGSSSDPVGDSLFYREVLLPFLTAMLDTQVLKWRFGAISSETQPPVVLTGLPVCGNCHSFSKDGKVLGMDVDYASDKGSYAMVDTAAQMSLDPENIISWVSLDPKDPTKTFGLLPQVSPDGRYVMATVKDQSIFVAVSDNLAYSQLFFPTKGVLGLYDRQENRFSTLPGASDPDLVQSNPVWSPDGKELIFARAKAYDISRLLKLGVTVLTPEDCPEFFGGGQKFKYDLYRIPFNGGAGGTPVPVEGASGNGKSNYFPRYSPDGKWLVFTQAESFMLLQPDSALYIMPAAGGTPRKMRANREAMNSWHSWSSNSRWLVFSSKVNGPYTQLFLTHIDAEGNDTPPVLLEQFTAPDRAANIPEFVALPPDAIKKIGVGFLDGDSYYKRAMLFLSHAKDSANPEDRQKAADMLALSIHMDPKNAKARNLYGLVLGSLGKTKEAAEQWQAAIKLQPDLPDPYNNLGLMYEKAGRKDKAEAMFKKAEALNPKLAAERQVNLALLRKDAGQVDKAEADLEAAVKARPGWYQGLFHLANLKLEAGKMEEAKALFLQAIAADPMAVEAHWRLGLACLELGQAAEAAKRLEEAVKRFPGEANLMDLLAVAKASAGDFKGAEQWATQALEAVRSRGLTNLANTIQAHLNDIRAGRIPGQQ